MNDKIITFDRPAQFYYDTAQKMMDKSDYLGALPLLRKAVEKEPKNEEYLLSLAEALTELMRYEESSQILMELVFRRSDYIGECMFGLGCNFVGQNNLERAKLCFEKYIDIEPDGEYREYAEEFLFLYDETEELQDFLLEDVKVLDAQKRAEEGKRLLDVGDYQKAAEVLQRIEADSEDFLFAQNNLSLCYYCLQRLDEAIETARAVLKRAPDNLHARCNLAIFLQESGFQEERDALVREIMSVKSDEPEQLYKVATTLCEVGEDEKALPYLNNLLKTSPYDEKLLFCTAIANYNLHHYGRAMRFFSDIMTLELDDSVAAYYFSLAKAMQEDDTQFQKLRYVYQVPNDEVRNRIAYLNQCLEKTEEEILTQWQSEKRLQEVLLWGLYCGDNFMKRSVAEILTRFADEKAVAVLQRYLLKGNQPDEMKSEIVMLLSRIHVPEPYVVNMGGSIVEMRVNPVLPGAQSRELTAVLEAVQNYAHYAYDAQVEARAEEVAQLASKDEICVFIMQDVSQYAAAVVVAALELEEREADIDHIARDFMTKESVVREITKIILRAYAEWKHKEGENDGRD